MTEPARTLSAFRERGRSPLRTTVSGAMAMRIGDRGKNAQGIDRVRGGIELQTACRVAPATEASA